VAWADQKWSACALYRKGDKTVEVAFLAMPYNAETHWKIEQNIQAASIVAARLWWLGLAVICPHTNSAHFGGVADEKVFYAGYEELVRRSDIIVAGPGWENSSGARNELSLGIKLGKRIAKFVEGYLYQLNTTEMEQIAK
jgi:hypothetical protein